MKYKIFFWLFLLCASLNSIAQDYTVVHVTGRISLKGKTSWIKTGESIKSKQQLLFPGQNAWAILIDEKGTQFFLAQPTSTDSIEVRAALQPIEKTTHPVTRNSTAPVKNLRTYFAGAQFVFIGNDFYLEVDSTEYPLDEKLFLLYRYVYNERTITHKIPQDKHVIHLNKPFLYESKGDSIAYGKTSNTELSYFNSNTNLPTFVAAFRPIWLNEELLKKELLVLQKVYVSQKSSSAELKKVFLQYVLDVYGKTDEIIFTHWVEKHVLLQK